MLYLMSSIGVALVLGQAPAGADPAVNDPRLVAAYEQMVGFLDKQPRYSLDVKIDWKVTGGEVEAQSGVNAFRYQLERPERYRIEVRPEGGEPSLIVVSDGAGKVTTFYPSKSLFARAAAVGLKEGLESNPILAMSLSGSLIDTLMRQDLVEVVKSHVTHARLLGQEEVGGRKLDHYGLTWRLDQEELWFGPAEEPLMRKLVMTRKVPGPDNKSTTLVSTATLSWKIGEAIPATAFQLELPKGAVEVSDIHQALSSGTTEQLLGQPAPAVKGARLGDGSAFELGAAKGKVVVLEFWAGWCGPCIEQAPPVAKLAEKGPAMLLVPVNVGETRAEVEAAVKAHPEFAGTLLDPDSEITGAYGINALPALVVIGPDGTLQALHVGMSADLVGKLRAEVEKLGAGEQLAKPAAP